MQFATPVKILKLFSTQNAHFSSKFLVEYSALLRREEELERLMKEALSKEVQMEKTLTNLTEQLEARGNIL